jgi:hypothetical protein
MRALLLSSLLVGDCTPASEVVLSGVETALTGAAQTVDILPTNTTRVIVTRYAPAQVQSPRVR